MNILYVFVLLYLTLIKGQSVCPSNLSLTAEPDQHLRVASEGLVKCRVSNCPTATISWSFNHSRLQLGGRYVLEEGGLRVKGVRYEDAGVYECRAEVVSEGRFATNTINIEVLSETHAPLIDNVEIFRTVGSSLVVSCKSVDGDVSSLRWLDPQNETLTSTGRIKTRVHGDKMVLEVVDFKEEDAGSYKCQREGLQTSVQLSIFKDISIEAEASQQLNLSSDGVIRCIVTASPAATVSWTFNNSNIQTGGRYVVEEGGLRVKGVRQVDAGPYKCRAEVVRDGRYTAKNIDVQVSCGCSV